MPVRNRFAELHEEITAWRRDFHEHPELMYDVHRTAGIVAAKLRGFGCDEVVTGIGRTGVVGIIRGKKDGGRSVGLRADMDALPIEEATGLPYASKTKGKMHACGHDGHTAILLGAAKYLAETRNFAGTVAVIFQPAEEGGAGGKAMVDDGLMERFGIDEVYGLHNEPGTPVGSFAIRPGPLMAASDTFEIVVTGKGGHAAEPHVAVDTTLAAAQIVVTLNTIVSRNVDPLKSAVLTVGTFTTDSRASNVIAHQARIEGTVRTFDADVRATMEARLRRVAEDTASAFGASAKFNWHPGYPATVNHAEETRHALRAARAVSGDVKDDIPPIMPAEDFAFMLEARPGAYIFLGNGPSAMCHHPEYAFDDDAIPFGCSYFVELVEQRLPAT
jgi:hippurate hydrolase